MGIVRSFAYQEVEGLRAGRFALQLNTSAVCYRIGTTLIDCGAPNRWTQVRSFVQQRPPQQLLLTHHHEDHSGNSARIQAEFGTRVLAHPSALPELATGWCLRPYQLIFWGKPQRCSAQPVPEEIVLDEGFRLKTLPTPGHADDLVCYLEPERGWLFTGDLYIGSRPRYLRQDENLSLQIESLRAVLRHDFRLVFCGHRGIVQEGRQALTEKLDYLLSFVAQVQELRSKGMSVRAITRKLLGPEDFNSLATLGHFTKGNLVRGCLTATDRN